MWTWKRPKETGLILPDAGFVDAGRLGRAASSLYRPALPLPCTSA
jgi:hypothetical protein